MCEIFVTNVEKIPNIDTSKQLNEQKLVYEKYNDTSEGSYPCLKIDTKEELEYWFKCIEEMESKNKTVYRGQSDSNWKVTSSLEREIFQRYPNGIDIEQYNKISKAILTSFKDELRGKVKEQLLLLFDNSLGADMEFWAIGQHHGLKTPLIDWTYSFYTSLFFAFEKKPKGDNKYHAVIRVLEPLFYVKENEINIVNPKMDHYGRITAQRGLFSYWGIDYRLKTNSELIDEYIRDSEEYKDLERNKAKMKIMTKYYINDSLSEIIESKLKHLGINETTIYPDLQGAINKTNKTVSDIISTLAKV